MKRLSVERIKQIHSLMIEETGGLNGVRDEGLLESAVNAPFQTFGGAQIRNISGDYTAEYQKHLIDYLTNVIS